MIHPSGCGTLDYMYEMLKATPTGFFSMRAFNHPRPTNEAGFSFTLCTLPIIDPIPRFVEVPLAHVVAAYGLSVNIAPYDFPHDHQYHVHWIPCRESHELCQRSLLK
jgi:hypothetical protein